MVSFWRHSAPPYTSLRCRFATSLPTMLAAAKWVGLAACDAPQKTHSLFNGITSALPQRASYIAVSPLGSHRGLSAPWHCMPHLIANVPRKASLARLLLAPAARSNRQTVWSSKLASKAVLKFTLTGAQTRQSRCSKCAEHV